MRLMVKRISPVASMKLHPNTDESTKSESHAAVGIGWVSESLGDLSPVIIIAFILGTVCHLQPASTVRFMPLHISYDPARLPHGCGSSYTAGALQAFGIMGTSFMHQFPEWLQSSNFTNSQETLYQTEEAAAGQ